MMKLRLASLNDSLNVTYLVWACIEAQMEKRSLCSHLPNTATWMWEEQLSLRSAAGKESLVGYVLAQKVKATFTESVMLTIE